jgi:hypothetical protein
MERTVNPGTRHVALIGCEVLERELAALSGLGEAVASREILPAGLHVQPTRLRAILAQAIAHTEERPEIDTIVLAYGLCGSALVGLGPSRCSLVVPRAHDCVTLFLGNKERYAECMKEDPGLYWYMPGWCRHGLVPSPDREERLRAEYRVRFDPDQVDELIEMDRESVAQHHSAAYTDLQLPGDSDQFQYSKTCAECRGWSMTPIHGDSGLLRDLLNGPWDPERFLVVHPGQRIALCAHGDAIIKAVPQPP